MRATRIAPPESTGRQRTLLPLFVALIRLGAAVLGIVALVGRYNYGLDFITHSTANFFGYLTIQSNVAAVAMFASTGVLGLAGIAEERWISRGRLAITCYLTVAGIVFALLASQASVNSYRLEVTWSDQLLHYWIPAIAMLDWVFAPGRHRLTWRAAALVLAYPLVWGMYTMVRGAVVGWYPYFFLDPNQVSGVGEFALYSLFALVLFAAVAALLNLASRLVPPMGWVTPPRS